MDSEMKIDCGLYPSSRWTAPVVSFAWTVQVHSEKPLNLDRIIELLALIRGPVLDLEGVLIILIEIAECDDSSLLRPRLANR